MNKNDILQFLKGIELLRNLTDGELNELAGHIHGKQCNAQYDSERTRSENDLLGEREVPAEAYYGVQTLRAMENFNISAVTLNSFPSLIEALSMVKEAAAEANHELGLLDRSV
ncbi:MAG TPA: hypothetical protein PKZ50_07470, partial [Bacteroidales bacterium]|nr:hypothetical protein [Bacteroidales bacterium]